MNTIEAGKLLGLSHQRVRVLIKTGELPAKLKDEAAPNKGYDITEADVIACRDKRLEAYLGVGTGQGGKGKPKANSGRRAKRGN